MNRKLYNELKAKVESLEKQINGGKGSGNFGHSGRPGKKGGSAPQGTTPFKAGDAYKKDGETFTVEDDGRGGLQGVADGGNIVSEVPSKKGIEEAKKHLKEVQDAIEDNITRASQAAMAAREEGKDVAEYTTKLHEERQELRERAARLQSRIDSYESALRRKEHEEKIGKIIGTEKIRQGQDKKTDDANYKKLEKDIREIQKVLAKEPNRENFGQDEVRKLKDKYSDYMSGNWSVVGKFVSLIQDFDRWASERPWGNAFTATPEQLAKTLNGGKGSGNFGHSGRPGEVGGSAPSGTAPQGKTSEKRAYDHLRSNYTELGFDGSLVDTDFADDKAMTIFSSLESSDIMQLAEDKVKADDIYYSLEGNIYKFYKEGRDNASNLQSYMQKTNHSINEAINEVMSYGKTLAQASQLPEDTKKDFWLMDKDERSNPGNRARTLLDDVERRLLRHEFDSEGFTEFAKVSQQRIQALREVITHYDEINERVLDTPRSDKIIQDPAKKQA